MQRRSAISSRSVSLSGRISRDQSPSRRCLGAGCAVVHPSSFKSNKLLLYCSNEETTANKVLTLSRIFSLPSFRGHTKRFQTKKNHPSRLDFQHCSNSLSRRSLLQTDQLWTKTPSTYARLSSSTNRLKSSAVRSPPSIKTRLPSADANPGLVWFSMTPSQLT